MLLSEIIRNKYSCFDSLEVRKKSGSINAVKYIRELGQMTQTNIAGWDISEVFKNPKSEFILIDKRAINKVFFDYCDKHQEDNSLLPTDLLAGITAAERTIGTRKVAGIKRSLNNLMSSIRVNERKIEQDLTKAAKYRNEAVRYENGQADLLNHIKRLVAQGFWDVDGVSDHEIICRTKEPITLTFKNIAQKVDYSVPMGEFEVILRFDQGIKVYSYEDNITSRYHIHPHVSQNASVCYGTASDAKNDAFKILDVFTLFDITRVVLTTYYDGNPFVSLDSFKKQYEEMEIERKENEKMELEERAQEAREEQAQTPERRIENAATNELASF